MNYEQRKELKRQIDEAKRDKLAKTPSPIVNYNKIASHKTRLHTEADFVREGDDDICIECKMRSSKFTSGKYKHEITCSKRD